MWGRRRSLIFSIEVIDRINDLTPQGCIGSNWFHKKGELMSMGAATLGGSAGTFIVLPIPRRRASPQDKEHCSGRAVTYQPQGSRGIFAAEVAFFVEPEIAIGVLVAELAVDQATAVVVLPRRFKTRRAVLVAFLVQGTQPLWVPRELFHLNKSARSSFMFCLSRKSTR